MIRWLFIFLAVCLAGGVSAEDYVDLVRKGNESYKLQDYKKALEYYHNAETELPESVELEYNMAGALYQQGNYEETVDRYTRALNTEDIGLETQAHYNLGNTYYRMGDYQNAILSYQRTLEINPDDVDAKFNLELARRMLKEQIKPEQQQEGQDSQPQPQQQENQNSQEEQPEPEEQPQDQPQPQEEQQQPEQRDERQMSREDAERILNALRDDEQELQKKIKREVTASDYIGKDW
ncbi:MAG: tetratricopeptide repeat protein [Candidatus Zixiibacteriota bacterium]|nr:MAG: tetratricopeptide repeat protein [candidate division Zixibacteria bacterium]